MRAEVRVKLANCHWTQLSPRAVPRPLRILAIPVTVPDALVGEGILLMLPRYYKHQPTTADRFHTQMSIRNPCSIVLPTQQLRPLVLPTICRKSQRNLKPNAVFVRKYAQKPPMQQINLAPRPSTSQKKWNQLTAPQKVVRTATTGGSLLTILAGMALTVRCYLLQTKPKA